jgi:hypothetical protein
MWARLLSLSLAAAPALAGPPPEALTLEGDISPIHDPAIIRERGTYHFFASNRTAPTRPWWGGPRGPPARI